MSVERGSGRLPSHSKSTILNASSRILRSGTREAEKQRSREVEKQGSSEAAKEEPEGSRAAEKQGSKKVEKQGSREAAKEEPEGSRAAEKQKEEPEGRIRKMEKEVWEKLATETPLKAEYVQKLWDFWIEERPNYAEFLKHTLPVVMAVSGNFAPFLASSVATILWEKFQEVDEALKVPSTFSKLSLCDSGKTAEHHLLSVRNCSLCSSSTAGSAGPPLLFQDKGVEALGCDMCDHHHPAAPKDAIVEELFPEDDWCKVMSATDTKCESKLKTVFDIHRKKALELANFVFVKPKKELCDPKIPDFVLVDKEYWESPTADTVGALLFAQSSYESSKSYSTTYAIGEAVAVAQVLLRRASQMRHFIFTGVTNGKRIRWFRVERPGINGTFNGSRCAETPLVIESLAGMMCSAKENLGIRLQRSIVVGQEEYRLWRWLGEGATSYVHAVNVGGVLCAAKVAKLGHSISMDVSNLERLQDIKGIPKIVMSDPPSVLFIKPVVAEQFSLAQLCKNKMYNRVGELVETLECAHNRGIVNRDIRIANILIAEDQFIIVDWGFAASSNEPEVYSGTSHFASTRVLKILEEGQYTLVFEPSDDLVSLVRSLYAFTRLSGVRLRSGLTDLSNDDFAEIQAFWETELSNSPWLEAESYAKQCDYAALKDWIQKRFQTI